MYIKDNYYWQYHLHTDHSPTSHGSHGWPNDTLWPSPTQQTEPRNAKDHLNSTSLELGMHAYARGSCTRIAHNGVRSLFYTKFLST